MDSVARKSKLEELRTNQLNQKMTGIPLRYKGTTREEVVWRIPLDYLIYNKYNGRIGSDVLSYEKQNGELNAELDSDREIIEKFLYESKEDRNKTTMKSLLEIGQQRYGIVTSDGIIVDGNRRAMLLNRLFHKREELGYTYLGPVDGHDIEELERMLKISKQLDGPVLIHVLTKKGKGYKIAEENPDRFHATGPFDIETGSSKKKKEKDYSKAFGDKLVELAKKNNKIVAITAAMKDGTGLSEFAKEFPDRFFDVGIAEQHALGLAAGMAREGIIPVVPIYSSFYQRAYDQVIHDIAIQNLPVIMCVDRAGVVGQDRRNTSRYTRYGIF